jgi:hypothetical protein
MSTLLGRLLLDGRSLPVSSSAQPDKYIVSFFGSEEEINDQNLQARAPYIRRHPCQQHYHRHHCYSCHFRVLQVCITSFSFVFWSFLVGLLPMRTAYL